MNGVIGEPDDEFLWRRSIRRDYFQAIRRVFWQDFIEVMKVEPADDLPRNAMDSVSFNSLCDETTRQNQAARSMLKLLTHFVHQSLFLPGMKFRKNLLQQRISRIRVLRKWGQGVNEIVFIKLICEIARLVNGNRQEIWFVRFPDRVGVELPRRYVILTQWLNERLTAEVTKRWLLRHCSYLEQTRSRLG